MDQKAWKQEMQVAKLLEEAEAIAGDFNKKAESLNVSSPGCRRNTPVQPVSPDPLRP